MNVRRWAVVLTILLTGALAACAAPATPAPVGWPRSVPAATSAPAATAAPGNVGGQASLLPAASQMIIKNADLELLVSDTKGAVVSVTQLAADDGGYILSSETSYVGDQQHASLRLAVPATQFEAALNQLRRLGIRVIKEGTTGQDVSAEYTDLQSRLNNLEATAARVRTFLDASKTVEDSLRVNGQLSDLEGQIEQIKGQMKYYEGRAAFSLVTVTLTPQVVAVSEPEPAWSPLRTLSRALATLGQMLRVGTDFSIWLVVLTSPLAVALVAVILLRKIFVRRTAPRS